MAEVPSGYLPDAFVGLEPQGSHDYATEVIQNRDGSEQRRGLFRSAGYRRFVAVSAPLGFADRLAVMTFLKARQGRLSSFYAFDPALKVREDLACGSVAAASRFIVPAKITGPIGGGSPLGAVIGSISDVRVAGVTKAFTVRHLIPRPTTYSALRFDGAGSFVDCGSNSSLRGTGAMTICAWVYGVDWSAPRTIVANRVGGASGIILYVAFGGALTFETDFASSSTSGASSFTLPTDAWTHVAVTRTSGGPAIFFKNGVQFNTTASLTNPATATISFKIGSEPSGANPFSGMLNDVRLYDSALSGGEILNIYNNAATPSANLRGWWRMTEGTGTTAADSSGATTNNGTLSGSAIPVWVAGEEEITFTGGAQTGEVKLWSIVRERLTMRYDSDSIEEAFWRESSAPMAVIRLPLKEVA